MILTRKIVLSDFPSDQAETKLMALTFQNMFPAINIQTVKLSECRRVALFAYDKETGVVHFRHYVITVRPSGVTRTIKRIVTARIPNMKNFDDVSEYVLGTGYLSESEAEDLPESHVTLAQDYVGRGNVAHSQSSVRLQEVGPRMELKLVKVQEGFCDGSVIFHQYITKTPEEIESLQERRAQKEKLKEKRRKQQEENIKKKKGDEGEQKEEEESDEEDLDWYRKEVGEDPKDLEFEKDTRPKKKVKFNPIYRKKKNTAQNDQSDKQNRSDEKKKHSKKKGKKS